MPSILIVDDEKSLREVLEILFSNEGFDVFTSKNVSEAITILEGNKVDVVLSDLILGKESGLDLARSVNGMGLNIPFVLITAYASPETAMESVKLGVIDYISKPFDNDKLVNMIKKLISKGEHLREIPELDEIVGNSSFVKELKKKICDVAEGDATVLLSGESGTGKELVARAIHRISKRGKNNFIAVNCGAIPSDLLESEFFGYKKGAFTGAYSDKKGLFEMASGGTIFLDEITELPLNMQVKLLRVLQERKVMKVGSSEEIDIDVRIISATNRNIDNEVDAGRFRKDLYYRINVVQIEMLPLRDRMEDIEPLAKLFLKKFSAQMGKNISEISYPVIEILKSYEYKGNVRELQNIIERGVTLEKSDRLLPGSILGYFSIKNNGHDSLLPELKVNGKVDLGKVLETVEKKYITCALNLSNNNQSKAARMLGISLRVLRYKMSKYNVK
ncbi:MAG: sigma-54 dependent transcriptional regulator [Calditerrivibrio sp.]|nr:sigma-54 dependent transcriptional regulator [Calditerrivibrio sp.]MCA1980883.1 sigma-54 dependent transcriptional regulator [Calditerrivibrio sp.]